jgi:23S rRNA pseudouridine955/2504/2580 synthase
MPEETGKKVSFVTIDEASAGQRLDNFLLKTLKGVPKSLVYRIVRKGEVRVNKGRISVSYRLQDGDLVRIPPVRVSSGENAGQPSKHLKTGIDNAILFEDERYLVINKPSGMAVHGGSGVSHGVIETLRAMRPEQKFMELAHRLDRETSGCLLVAKKREALTTFQDLQRKGKVDKKYLALVDGNWGRKTAIEIDAPLKKNTLKGGERIVQVDADGKDSVTRFRVLEQFKSSMLVEAELLTGRTHQIRVHLQHAGTPIIGDDKYGNVDANRYFREKGVYRLFLHAFFLSFHDPLTGTLLTFEAPLDTDLQQALEAIRQ